MTRAELIAELAASNPHLRQEDAELIVTAIFDQITAALARGGRVELRGFGAFTVKQRPARIGRNPRTHETVRSGGLFIHSISTRTLAASCSTHRRASSCVRQNCVAGMRLVAAPLTKETRNSSSLRGSTPGEQFAPLGYAVPLLNPISDSAVRIQAIKVRPDPNRLPQALIPQTPLVAVFIACASIAPGLKSGGAWRGGKSLNVSACSLRM